MTVRAYGKKLTKRLANIDVINGYGRVLTFGHRGTHVDEQRFCHGATVVHHVSDVWDVQLILWGGPIPDSEQRAIINTFLGSDQ